MKIFFYTAKNSDKCPVKEFIEKLESGDKARILACLKNIEELGFYCPRVEFRHIEDCLWEIKIRSANTGFRIFYVSIKAKTLILLHAYKKKTQKAPQKEIKIAKQRMKEVIDHEKNHS